MLYISGNALLGKSDRLWDFQCPINCKKIPYVYSCPALQVFRLAWVFLMQIFKIIPFLFLTSPPTSPLHYILIIYCYYFPSWLWINLLRPGEITSDLDDLEVGWTDACFQFHFNFQEFILEEISCYTNLGSLSTIIHVIVKLWTAVGKHVQQFRCLCIILLSPVFACFILFILFRFFGFVRSCLCRLSYNPPHSILTVCNVIFEGQWMVNDICLSCFFFFFPVMDWLSSRQSTPKRWRKCHPSCLLLQHSCNGYCLQTNDLH